jgi:ubiquinone biosynthesis protein
MLLAPRYLPRLAATVGLFTRYGLKDFAQRQGLLELDPQPSGNGAHDAPEESDGVRERAAGFRKRLVELGPAYIKLGQVLSTRPDLIPEAYIRELEGLQDDVAPVPFSDIESTVGEELGARLSKLFRAFDHEPLGSASLGQVHAAVLRDGRQVVVKVQRPEIREQLADDVAYFQELARFMSDHTRAGQRVDMVGVIQQLERALADELDYRIEARNAAELRLSLAEFPRILIPRVVDAYTTGRVLTTERIRGVKIGDIPPVTRTEYEFSPLADDIAKAYLKQITICGHFHADPHPGNVFVVLPGHENPMTPAELHAADRRASPREAATLLTRIEQRAQAGAPPPTDEGPKLALIDFGMTARLSASMRDGVVRLLMDLADNRGDDAAETLIEMGSPIDEFDRESYMRDIATLVARNYSLSVGEVQAGEVLYEVISISYQHGLRLPAELTLLAKALFNLDAVTRALDPTYSPIRAIRDYTNQIANERAQRELSPRRLFQAASETTSLMTVLPHRLDVITQRMAANDFGFRIDAPQLLLLMKGLQRVANRIFTGLVLCGLLIASAMLHPYRRGLGTAGFVIAGVLALYMVLTILVSDRRRDG